jgi:hypothetical protein
VCKCVLYCTVLLPLGVNPISVNKYISYHIISNSIVFVSLSTRSSCHSE